MAAEPSEPSNPSRDAGPPRRALAELQYNSILASEQGNSSEDEAKETSRDPEESRKAIGISIGREQTRLISPTTPATEKAAAIENAGGFFGREFPGTEPGIIEDDEGDEDEEDERHPAVAGKPVATSPERSPPAQLPSPWRAESTTRSSKTRSVLRDGFSFRRRASSGPEQTGEGSPKASFFSIPKNFSLTSPFSTSRDASKDGDRDIRTRDRRSTVTSAYRGSTQSRSPQKVRDTGLAPPRSPALNRSRSPREVEEAKATVGDLPSNSNLQLHQVRSRPQPPLRRSTSDNSLITQRTLSRVSSLGDDSRFENVSEQVNSRMKAIKDSWHDSSIKLPSMPSISSFNVSNFTPDFFRERSGSDLHEKKAPKPVDPMTRTPYASAKAAVSDGPLDRSNIDHPNFTEALEQLEGDIVVLGGYRGSVLRSAEPPHRQLWVPIKVGLNIRKVDLEVGLDEDADERAAEKVIPGGMLTHIGPVDMSRRLFKRLRTCDNARSGKLRVHDYGYDWRLNPLHLSKKLVMFLESLPSNKPGVAKAKRGVTVIAHSLGGLITRHAVNHRPELFKGVIYAGVPKTCVNILGPLRNGDEVLLSSRVLTAQVNFTIRTSFALLPLDGRCFFDRNTKEEYPVDFFDPQTWIDNRLSPVIARPLPPLNPPPKPSGLSGYVSSMANAFPTLPIPGKKSSTTRAKSPSDPTKMSMANGAEGADPLNQTEESSRTAIAHGNIAQENGDEEFDPPSVRTAVTIPRDEALAYLTRTLATVKKFKQQLAHVPAHHAANVYPPISVIYGKTTPTVFGARVDGREGIKHADAYDELAFASGDGVVLAKAAMVPEGYKTARGGVVSSERGHVTLLGDLEAVGRCLLAIGRARDRGVGLGV